MMRTAEDLQWAMETGRDCIKRIDGGDQKTATGWAEDELLECWIILGEMIEALREEAAA